MGLRYFCKTFISNFVIRASLSSNKKWPDIYKQFFDEVYYLKNYSDIRKSQIDPLEHFINYGEREGRNPNSFFDSNYFNSLFNFKLEKPLLHFLENDPLQLPKINYRIRDEEWKVFLSKCSGKFLTEYNIYFPDLLNENKLDLIATKIRQLSKYEPKLFALGQEKLNTLIPTKNTDAYSRSAMSLSFLGQSKSILDAKFDAVFIVDHTKLGGALIYLAEFVELLAQKFQIGCCFIIINEHSQSQFEYLMPKETKFLYFRRFFNPSLKDSENLALLLSNLKNRLLFVCNSELGFHCLQDYGVYLSNYMKIFSFFFSESEYGIDRNMSARYVPKILDSSFIISDNNSYLNQIKKRISNNDYNKLVKIPRFFVNTAVSGFQSSKPNFLNRVHRISTSKHLKILWIGRFDSFKRLPLINSVSQRDNENSYFIYTNSPKVDFTWSKNVTICYSEDLFDWESTLEFDILIFSSEFEGMPNVVLEAALSGIPIISPRVGGIEEVFNEDDVYFYSNSLNDDNLDTVEILSIISSIKFEQQELLLNRLQSAYSKVSKHNDPRKYFQVISHLLGIENE